MLIFRLVKPRESSHLLYPPGPALNTPTAALKPPNVAHKSIMPREFLTHKSSMRVLSYFAGRFPPVLIVNEVSKPYFLATTNSMCFCYLFGFVVVYFLGVCCCLRALGVLNQQSITIGPWTMRRQRSGWNPSQCPAAASLSKSLKSLTKPYGGTGFVKERNHRINSQRQCMLQKIKDRV